MKYKLLLLLLVTYKFGISQEYNFNNFNHLSVSKGLSQSTVFAIEQDNLGQIWIGTRDGLNKYDGENIKIYRTEPSNPNSISNNDILSIKEDSEGFVWVGTHNGLNRYDPKKQLFTRYFYSTENNENQHFSIRTIVELNANELWIGTSSGVYIYDKTKKDFVEIKNFSSPESDLSESVIHDLFQDQNQNIWIGSNTGLFKIAKENIPQRKVEKIYAEERYGIQAIQQYTAGNLLLGTQANGLIFLDIATNKFIQNNELKNKINSSDIRRFTYDHKGNLWIGTYDGIFIRKRRGEVVKITNQLGNPKSLSKNSIKEVFVDQKGSVWIGTYYGGVNIWDTLNDNFHKFYEIKDGQAIDIGVVSSIVEDRNQMFYLATDGKGIKAIKNNGKCDFEVTRILNRKTGNSNVKTLFLEDNRLWIGTLKSGVYCFDIDQKRFITNQKVQQINQTLHDKRVYAIKKTDNYEVFGTFGDGIYVYDDLKEKMAHVTYIEDRDMAYSLSNDRVRCMLFDVEKNLWIGTDKGLNKISYDQLGADNPIVEHFLYEDETYYGYNIISIYENKKGEIFIGTKERGVLKFKNKDFQRIDLNLLHLEITSAFSIVEDDEENLWIGCNLGMVKYNPSTKKSSIYNQTEYFMGNEFINNSYLKASNNYLYFGGVKGVSFFNPSRIKNNVYSPKVIFTGLKVNGEDVDSSISYLDELELNYDETSFSIKFALPNYINSSNNEYAYRLVGLNNDWRFTSNNEISYTIQKPGNYVFQVKEANNKNSWYNEPTVIPIHVRTAPWKTTWAYLIYIAIVLFVLYQIYNNMRAKIILAHKLKLERTENTRQEELNKSKLEFFTNISHDFRTPLTLILAPLQQLLENYKGSKNMFNKLVAIERNANQLLKLTNQLLDFRSLEDKHAKLKTEQGNVVVCIKDIYQSFKTYAEIQNYEYSFQSDTEQALIYFDQNKLEKVFYNIISNAFKYTPKGGSIHVNVYQSSSEVTIEVSDTGKGISKEFIHKIFDRFYEVASDNQYQRHFNQGSGIGLYIAKKIIDLHKGEVTVESQEGIGTTFKVTLKKGDEHLSVSEIISVSDNETYTSTSNIYSSEFNNSLEKEFDHILPAKEKDMILVVEDNDEFRKFMLDILKETYNVVRAKDGDDGFKKALQNQPDLIISDVIMPNMLGTELCAKLKKDIRTSHIPILLLTSQALHAHKLEGLESGADAYFEKPFHVKEFLLSVKNLLNTKKRLLEQLDSIDYETVKEDTISTDDKLLKKAIKIVENYIDDPSFDIALFCSELGLSRTMLFVKIKAWTNLTPKEFILSLRMKRASRLLEKNEYTVAEVGYKVGFKDPKYFSKVFKKHYKKTPSEYADTFDS